MRFDRLRRVLLGAALVVGLVAPARAQDYAYEPYPYDDEYDEIRQTVARLSYVSGDVSFSRGDDPDEWQYAGRNVPMTFGDRVYTGQNGRLELQVHGGLLIRLAPRTELAALNLTDDTQQFAVNAGTAFFRLPRLRDDDIYEVDTPNAAITLERAGLYRVDVDPRGRTRFQVRRGRALVAAGGGQLALGTGDAIEIEGFETPFYERIGLGPRDRWDRWSEERDGRLGRVRGYDYVSDEIAGIEDLDQYGRWNRIPTYGWAWSPLKVEVGWAPYRFGRWIWQDPWGWTWVAAEPWGWAPYHYGRWVFSHGRWCWVPVAPRASVYYAPALVAFAGGGPGWSVSMGFAAGGYVGWFPLAPADPFIPWWGRPRVAVNVTNVTYVNRTYITVVNQAAFVSGRPVAPERVRDVSIVRQVERAPVLRGPVPVLPTRQSIRVSAREAPASVRPAARVASRSVVTRVAPPPQPPSFDTKVAVIRENRGAPVEPREAARIVEREGGQPRAVERVRPAAKESGPATLAPRGATSRAERPEPVSTPRGRPMATEQQPVASGPVTSNRSPVTRRPQPPERPRPANGRVAEEENREPREAQAPERTERPSERVAPTPRSRATATRPESADRGEPEVRQPERPQSQSSTRSRPTPVARERDDAKKNEKEGDKDKDRDEDEKKDQEPD